MGATKKPEAVTLGDIRASVVAGRPPKEGRWYWRIRRKGKTLRGLRATRDEIEIVVARLRSETPTSSHGGRGRGAAGVRTVDDLVRSWLAFQSMRASMGEISESTLDVYAGRVRLWRESHIADVQLHAVTRAAISDELQRWRAVEGFAQSTTYNSFTVLCLAWRWGKDRGHCPSLDLRKMVSRTRMKRVNADYTPTWKEVCAIVDTVPAWVRPIVRFMALTGARRAEAFRLQASAVRLADRVVVLTGKTGSRSFPLRGELLAMLVELLEDHPEPGGRLFHNVAKDSAYNQIRKAADQLGYPRISPHGFRRRVVMRLLEVTDPATVAKLTGHTVEVLLRDYVRPSHAELDAVLARAALSTQPAGDVVPFRAQKSGTDSKD